MASETGKKCFDDWRNVEYGEEVHRQIQGHVRYVLWKWARDEEGGDGEAVQ